MRRSFLALVLIAAGAAAFAQSARDDRAATETEAIKAALAGQAAAWNRGDIPAFMQSYDDSPETTFVGSEVRKGYGPILERYRTNYANREQMGTLIFSNLEVRLLPSSCGSAEYAVATGNFHLERTAAGAARKNDGIFSLVWHKGPEGWKIILDHSS